ncbi:membrane-associated proteins in eicosanoid and glutathione metabolism [Rickenella mellea]|uniref:Membrane-associated proteins in eicosanoid and glutathione metabolism n=1 Tax=Rickenella mellea TaxID=50990 RepID=A0A4R5XER1_9AGAM|nr:membrane-associated proteins in eicosanoid and glutathione metabolism [Rickenella mellea]
MPVATITLPDRFPLVLAAGILTYCVNIWQARLVGVLRKKAGIEYPQAYAEKAQVEGTESLYPMKFNCAQRAHQNTIETLPHVLFGLLVTGIRYPTTAAVLGLIYSFGRIMYTLGYSSGIPKRRFSKGGILGLGANYGIFLASTWTVGEMLWENFGY